MSVQDIRSIERQSHEFAPGRFWPRRGSRPSMSRTSISAYETCMTARPHPSGAEDFSEPGLNASANLGAYIRLLSDPSSTGVLWAPLFQGGFELRCLQLLSAAAWLLSLPGRTADGLEAADPCSSRTKGSFSSGACTSIKKQQNCLATF